MPSVIWAQTPPPLLVKQDAPLHRAATEQSETLAKLPAQSRVTAQGQREGAWVQVKTQQGISGWLRLFQLGQLPNSAAPNDADASWVRNASTWWGAPTLNRSQPTATSTIGIRGLDAADLARAQPNPAAVTQAESQRVTAAQAQSFAQRGGLRQRQINELPDTTPRPAAMMRDQAN